MSGSGLGADGAKPQLGCRLRLVMGVTHPRETRHGGFLCWVPLDGQRDTRDAHGPARELVPKGKVPDADAGPPMT